MKTNKEYHSTFWEWQKIKPEYRYYIIFSKWKNVIDYKALSITGYDNLNDALDEVKLLNEVYNSIPIPQKIYSENGSNYVNRKYKKYRPNNRYDWDFSNGSYFWGYALLDLENCEFIKISHNGVRIGYGIPSKINKKKDLQVYDYFFRKENEIPKDYEWHHHGAEYEGWLQFRWGDGKNAIDYVEPIKKERPGQDEYREIYDESTESYKRQKIRVVYVDWDDPLPKKEKGILYERPNHEPVIFPGEFGYDNDLNIQPWSLFEEINEEQYNEHIKDSSTSIENILGENNPLLKLKFNN